jgi:hypothetical protein
VQKRYVPVPPPQGCERRARSNLGHGMPRSIGAPPLQIALVRCNLTLGPPGWGPRYEPVS